MNRNGFTLIELIVVIALLGILSAVALPRFIDSREDAENASLSAILGAVRTSTLLGRSVWIAQGQPASAAIDGVTQLFSADGWPMAPSNGNQGCADLWDDLLQSPPPMDSFPAADITTTTWIAGGNQSLCLFIKNDGAALNFASQPYLIYYTIPIGNIDAGSIVPSPGYPE